MSSAKTDKASAATSTDTPAGADTPADYDIEFFWDPM